MDNAESESEGRAMIWFSCRQCGKQHGRADNLAGTMIFCDCGQGLRVPWASTIAEPEATEEPLSLPPARETPARQEPRPPVPDDQPRPPVPPRQSVPVPPGRPPSSPLPGRRPQKWRKVNPAYCFNHDEAASTVTCADCRLAFCNSCVVGFKGQTLCGPCKNFRIRGATRPPRVSALAIVALVVAVVSGPVAFCLSGVTFNSQVNSQGSIVLAITFSLLAMLVPSGGLVLAGFALREIESKPNVGGRGMAMTGAVTSLAGILWNVTIGLLLILKHVQG